MSLRETKKEQIRKGVEYFCNKKQVNKKSTLNKEYEMNSVHTISEKMYQNKV